MPATDQAIVVADDEAEVERRIAEAEAALAEAQAAALGTIADPCGTEPARKLAESEADARERYLAQLLAEAASKLAEGKSA